MNTLLKCIDTVFHITGEQVAVFTREFIEHMPEYIKKAFAPEFNSSASKKQRVTLIP